MRADRPEAAGKHTAFPLFFADAPLTIDTYVPFCLNKPNWTLAGWDAVNGRINIYIIQA